LSPQIGYWKINGSWWSKRLTKPTTFSWNEEVIQPRRYWERTVLW